MRSAMQSLCQQLCAQDMTAAQTRNTRIYKDCYVRWALQARSFVVFRNSLDSKFDAFSCVVREDAPYAFIVIFALLTFVARCHPVSSRAVKVMWVKEGRGDVYAQAKLKTTIAPGAVLCDFGSRTYP